MGEKSRMSGRVKTGEEAPEIWGFGGKVFGWSMKVNITTWIYLMPLSSALNQLQCDVNFFFFTTVEKSKPMGQRERVG